MTRQIPPHATKNQLLTALSTSNLVQFLLLIAAGWAVLMILEYFNEIIITFTTAAVLAFLLSYAVKFLQRFIGRSFALTLVIILTLVFALGLVTVLGTAVTYQLQQSLGAIATSLSSPDNRLEQWADRLAQRNINIDLTPITNIINSTLTNGLQSILGAISGLPNTLLSFIFILVITFFMLTDGNRLWNFILKWVPESHQARVERAIQRSFLGFFRGQLILCLFLSSVSFLIFVLLQVPYPLVLAIIIAVLDAIPGIGATLGVVSISLIALVQGGWISAVKVLFASLILQQIQDNFVSPRVMQDAVNLNPVIVFFALMVGAKVGGLLGIFLSVPIAGAIVSLLELEDLQSK